MSVASGASLNHWGVLMATSKQRITISLTLHQYNVISSLASLGNGSRSGFITDLIDASMPVLERTAETLQRVKDAYDENNARLRSSMAAAQSDLEPVVDAALSQFDLFLGDAETAYTARLQKAKKVRALPARPPAAKRGRTDSQRAALRGGSKSRGLAASAPSTNRGATSQFKTSAKPTTAMVSAVFSKNKILKKGGGKKP
jgi:hypothetical protein